MKKYLASLLVSVCCVSFGFSQSKEITFDYRVTYVIPSQKRNALDTLVVSMDKSGRYLYTNTELPNLEFSRTVFPEVDADFSSARTTLLLDNQKMDIYFHFEFEDNFMFFKINLEKLIPMEADALDGDLNLISEKLSEQTTINGIAYDSYLLYPLSEPENPLTLVIDSERFVNNEAIIGEFIKMMLRKTKSTGQLSMDFPEGLILSVSDGQNAMIKAIKVEDVTTKINIHHSFNITE